MNKLSNTRHGHIVQITYNREHQLYQARCAEAPGMFVDSPSLEEAIEVVMNVLPDMLEEDSPAITPLFQVDPSSFSHAH